MSATSITLRGRQAAEALMLDACTVTRTATSTVDPDTGLISGTTTTIYSGKCKVQQAAPASSPTDIAEAAVFLNPLTLHVPVDAVTALIAPDDLATITASALDPGLVGRTFRLRGPAHKSFATARRFPVTEVAG